MKKLISILLAAAMLLSLTACGSTAADAAADDPEAETASADASAETPPELPDSSRCERRAFVFMSVDMRFSECRSVFPRSVSVLLAEAGEEGRGFTRCVEVREVGEAGHAEDGGAFLTLFCGDDGDAARQGHRMVPERDGRAVEQA